MKKYIKFETNTSCYIGVSYIEKLEPMSFNPSPLLRLNLLFFCLVFAMPWDGDCKKHLNDDICIYGFCVRLIPFYFCYKWGKYEEL